MTQNDECEEQLYDVVVNHEEQYSIWPVGHDLPNGWRRDGKTGTRSQCLSYVDEVWTDMRPLSLRRHMAEHANDAPVEATEPVDDSPCLVDRLCEGAHPVQAVLRPESSAAELKAAIDRRYVLIRFTGTRGGTELGVRVDLHGSDLTNADFDAGTGQALIVGTLELDFEPVRCRAAIDVRTLSGEGQLERAGG
ncbi:MbtH family NRPS accessory protein [Kribbella sp. NBC_01505]